MQITITSFPVGVGAPRSALEALIGLTVEANIIGDRLVVLRKEIVKSLAKKKSMFVRFWRKGQIDQPFDFLPNS